MQLFPSNDAHGSQNLKYKMHHYKFTFFFSKLNLAYAFIKDVETILGSSNYETLSITF